MICRDSQESQAPETHRLDETPFPARGRQERVPSRSGGFLIPLLSGRARFKNAFVHFLLCHNWLSLSLSFCGTGFGAGAGHANPREHAGAGAGGAGQAGDRCGDRCGVPPGGPAAFVPPPFLKGHSLPHPRGSRPWARAPGPDPGLSAVLTARCRAGPRAVALGALALCVTDPASFRGRRSGKGVQRGGPGHRSPEPLVGRWKSQHPPLLPCPSRAERPWPPFARPVSVGAASCCSK